MTTLDPWQEFIKGLEMAEEMERNRPVLAKEFRLYHNEDGTIIGLWESGFPEGDNYIVIDHPDVFHRNNTHYLRIVDRKLSIIDPRDQKIRQLYKSTSGYQVVKNNAALLITEDDVHIETEFYDRTNN